MTMTTKTKMAVIAAFVTVLAGVPAAYAADQQATGAEMDYQLNIEMARQGASNSGAHAQAPRSANRVQSNVSTQADDFQLDGR
jgi:hypothetical protein